MKTIKISDYVSLNQAATVDEGQKIYDLIIQYLEKKEVVELDFSDITVITTAFLNIAIGCLYKDHTSEELNEYIKFSNLLPGKKDRITMVVENAKIFYSDKKDLFEKNVDDAIYGSKNL